VSHPPSPERPAGRFERATGHLLHALGLWDLFQVALWTLFLLAGPPICLLRGLHFAAVVCSALGLFLANYLFTPATRFAAMPGRAMLRWGMTAELLVVGLLSLGLLFSPPDSAWSLVPGSHGWTDAGLALHRGELLALRSASGGRVVGRYRAEFWDFLPYPGAPTWAVSVAPDGALWAAPQEDDELLVLDPGAREWRHLPRPDTGFVRALHADDGVVLVTSKKTYRLTPAGQWAPFGPDFATDACRAGSRWVMVSPRGIFEGDDGASFWQVQPWDARFPLAACAPDGRAYALDGGMLWGQLRARTAEGFWQERPLPAPDVRALVVNPQRGDEVWLGTWGEGVFRSLDGGQRWEKMGLAGFEIRSMVVDFQAHRALAVPANLAVRSGIWARGFSP